MCFQGIYIYTYTYVCIYGYRKRLIHNSIVIWNSQVRFTSHSWCPLCSAPNFYHWFQLLSIFELSDFQSQQQLKSFFFQPEHPVKLVCWLTWLQTNPETRRIMKSVKKNLEKKSWKNSPPCWRDPSWSCWKSLLSRTLKLWVFRVHGLKCGHRRRERATSAGANIWHAMYIHILYHIVCIDHNHNCNSIGIGI